MVNAYAVQSGGCRFESLWGFGFSLKGALYQVDYCGKKNFFSWTAMHIDFVMCKKVALKKDRSLKKRSFKTKNWEKIFRIFSNFFEVSAKSHSAEKCEKGTLQDFITFVLLQDIKKLKGGRFGDIKNFLEKIRESKKFLKKIRILNSLIVPKILNKGPFWDFLTFVLLQNIKKLKGGLFGTLKKFRKKVSQSRKVS